MSVKRDPRLENDPLDSNLFDICGFLTRKEKGKKSPGIDFLSL